MKEKASEKKKRRPKKGRPHAPSSSTFAPKPKKKKHRVLAISAKTPKRAAPQKKPRKKKVVAGSKHISPKGATLFTGPRPANKDSKITPGNFPSPEGVAFVDCIELPVRYGRTGVTLMARDPTSVYAYWEIAPMTLKDAQSKLGASLKKASWTLRMFDVTGVDFNGSNANSQFDVDVDLKAQSRYIILPNDNATLCADLGFRTPAGAFYPLARSNLISTPSANVSDCSEITWAKVKHKQGAKPYVVAQSALPAFEHKNIDWASKGPGRDRNSATNPTPENNAPLAHAMPTDRGAVPAKSHGKEPGKALIPENSLDINAMHVLAESNIASSFALTPSGVNEKTWFSGDIAPSSSDIFGGASEHVHFQREFFFQLNAELVVYGRTEPGALVTMDGQMIDLREDGTFSQRLAFPDGVHSLDFCARPAASSEKKTITLTVGRTTFVHP